MKISSLYISNFRGVRLLEAKNLGNTIVIAGQNGSGKSCIFDAIRLLKSTYGGYEQNEYQKFFGEFAIQIHGDAANLTNLFNDKSRPVIIDCSFEIQEHERAYIAHNASSLIEETIWRSLLPEAFQFGGFRKALFSAQFRQRQPEVDQRVQTVLPEVNRQLTQPEVKGKIVILPGLEIRTSLSPLLEVIFSNYRPRDIGVIDFHGAQRHYGREHIQGINLSLEQSNQQQGQHAIYDYSHKYNNVKSEMASNFIKEMLAEKAVRAEGSNEVRPLIKTLEELFASFFPDKKFLGPQPTSSGGLDFPVETPSGTTHDLDELSSGEKEILYGYLRIRSSAPKESIILLDEPELHLNPRLIRGLPEFYRKHLGEELGNQLWLVTHSDALIREAVGKQGFNVFHMMPCGTEPEGTSQLRPLTVTEDLEVVLADLVGDLAAYRPGGKGLIFEGGCDSDFDRTFTQQIFGNELRGFNLISGSNKMRVQVLHEVLERAHAKGDLPTKFYAIMDRDADDEAGKSAAINRFRWDVYHIENYLLDPKVITDVVNSLLLEDRYDVDKVMHQLEQAARKVVPKVAAHRLREFVNSKLVGSIDLGFDPNSEEIGKEMSQAISKSIARVNASAKNHLAEEEITKQVKKIREEMEQAFITGAWIRDLPGRDILKQFVSLENLPVGHETLRNLILSRMVELGIQPDGMKKVISQIQND